MFSNSWPKGTNNVLSSIIINPYGIYPSLTNSPYDSVFWSCPHIQKVFQKCYYHVSETKESGKWIVDNEVWAVVHLCFDCFLSLLMVANLLWQIYLQSWVHERLQIEGTIINWFYLNNIINEWMFNFTLSFFFF